MSKKEKIVCAAVRFEKEHVRTGIESNINVLCVNYADENIEEARFRFENNPYYFVNREIEGFITNKNRFVDQREAMKIALKANQISSVEEVAIRVSRHKSLGNTSTARVEASALVSMVELYLARELKPEDLY